MKENIQVKNKGISIVRVIKNPQFRLLWISQIFSQLGDKFFIVLAILMISKYWADPLVVDIKNEGQAITILATGIYLSNSIPAILFGALAGTFADIFSKVKVMIFSNLFRATLVLLIPFCLIQGPLILGVKSGYWFLLIITFLVSSLTQLFTPAEQSLIPLIARDKNLIQANSIYQSTTIGATIFGFALGESILRYMNSSLRSVNIPGGEYLLLPICYGIASFLLTRIQIDESIPGKRKNNIWLEIKSGLLILKEITSVRKAIIQLIILYSLMASLYIISISLASSIPELGPTGFGILLASSGIGLASGAFIVSEKSHLFSSKQLAKTGLSLIGICLCLLSQSQGMFTPNIVFCSLIGAGASLVAIPSQTTIQRDTPEESFGKVFGLQNNLINISLSLPLLITGALVASLGLESVLWLLAAISLFGALLDKNG